MAPGLSARSRAGAGVVFGADGRPLPVEGSEAPNVVTATAFLKAFNDGRMRHVGKRVVVVGADVDAIERGVLTQRV